MMRALTASLAAAVALAAPSAAGAGGTVLAPPRHGGIYRAAFPDFGGAENRVTRSRLHHFERLDRRPVTWAYFSNNWFHGHIGFPGHDIRTIHRARRVPFVRLMARSGFGQGPDAHFSMESIANGEWDADLHAWCAKAAGLGFPILAEFGTEVNGNWFPWNGEWNGGGADTDHNGIPDGPENFRHAYRHIVDICRAEGADDITWFWHVDVGPYPLAAWNRTFANYYPGKRYVDWIGLSDYGPLQPGQRWTSFRRRLDRVYGQIARLPGHRPIAVLEYGAAEDPDHPGRKARWIAHAIHNVATHRWPRIRALSYWHEAWQNHNGSHSNLHIDSSRSALRAYRHGISRGDFTSSPRFEQR